LTGSNVGGLVGLNEGSVNSSYWNTDTAVSSWGTGLTSVQMLHKSNFTGFDFTVTPVWGRNAAVNSGRPILCAFGACITTVSVYAEPVTSFSTYTSTPVFTYREVDVNGSDFTLINAAASYGPGQGAVADVTLRIGNNGSTLQIVTGGIRLPGNLPELNE
jgi:hypothetical protein